MSWYMMLLRMWWADSRGKVVALLLFLWAAAMVHTPRIEFFFHVVVALAASILLDVLVAKLRYGIWLFSLSSVITGLLIGLVADPTGGIVFVLATVAIAVLSKHFVGQGRQKHIFNPAAFALVVTSIVFNRPVSWWGAAWGLVPVVILAAGMAWVLRRLGRIWAPLTFLLTYFASNLLFSSLSGALRLTFDGTVFLFALVMLTEPLTSVNMKWWRYWWGGIVGVLVLVQSLLKLSVGDPLLVALLVANLLGFLLVRRPRTRHS